MRRHGRAPLLFAVLLLSLTSAQALAESAWVPLTPAEGERLLSQAIAYATFEWRTGNESHIGVPYVWGGRTTLAGFEQAVASGEPEGKGVDASGLVVAAVKALWPDFRFRARQGGEWVPVANVNSSSLYEWNVLPIDQSELRPGDLIFFGSNGRIDGVAIYERQVGRSIRFVVASANSGKVVQTGANLDGEYWATRFAGAGRLLRSEL